MTSLTYFGKKFNNDNIIPHLGYKIQVNLQNKILFLKFYFFIILWHNSIYTLQAPRIKLLGSAFPALRIAPVPATLPCMVPDEKKRIK